MEQTHDSPTALELYKGHPVQEAAQIILGSLLFSASMNWIILPHDMYSGGFLGIAQLLECCCCISSLPSSRSATWRAFFIFC